MSDEWRYTPGWSNPECTVHRHYSNYRGDTITHRVHRHYFNYRNRLLLSPARPAGLVKLPVKYPAIARCGRALTNITVKYQHCQFPGSEHCRWTIKLSLSNINTIKCQHPSSACYLWKLTIIVVKNQHGQISTLSNPRSQTSILILWLYMLWTQKKSLSNLNSIKCQYYHYPVI